MRFLTICIFMIVKWFYQLIIIIIIIIIFIKIVEKVLIGFKKSSSNWSDSIYSLFPKILLYVKNWKKSILCFDVPKVPSYITPIHEIHKFTVLL